MEQKNLLSLVVKSSTAFILGAIIIIGSISNAHADRKCEAALDNLEKEMRELMIVNREYAKTLMGVVKKIKKSAKRYKVDKKTIAAIASDTSVSKKEAAKTKKMEKKLEVILDELKTVEDATKEMRDKLGEVGEAYGGVDNDCDAER